jgi:hypothetical protein
LQKVGVQLNDKGAIKVDEVSATGVIDCQDKPANTMCVLRSTQRVPFLEACTLLAYAPCAQQQACIISYLHAERVALFAVLTNLLDWRNSIAVLIWQV